MGRVEETTTAKSYIYAGEEESVKSNTEILIVRGSSKAVKEAEELLRLQDRIEGLVVAKW